MLHTECVGRGRRGRRGASKQADERIASLSDSRHGRSGPRALCCTYEYSAQTDGGRDGHVGLTRLPAYPLERAACLTLDFDSVRLKGGTAHPESLDNAERGTIHAEPSSCLPSSTPRPQDPRQASQMYDFPTVVRRRVAPSSEISR